MSAAPQLPDLVEALADYGLLLQTDSKLPSVAALVAGEPVKGSWWAHPKSHDIFRATRKLVEHSDVLVTKLVSGKTTHVHRALWPAVLAVARSRESWQLRALSPGARSLLEKVQREGRVETSGAPPRELERALLVSSEQFHTGAGSHAKALESWDAWSRRVRFRAQPLGPLEAKQQLERAVAALNRRFGGRGRLPWPAMHQRTNTSP